MHNAKLERSHTEIIIREMTPDDYDRKGFIHYKSWLETYTGLMDAQFLANQTLDKCQTIAHRWPQNTLLADCNGETVGFGCFIRHPDGRGEISAIYVLREYHSKGIGRKLMNALMIQLCGCTPVSLWVLQGNDHAIGFYQHCGFQLDGVTKIIPGTSCIELHMTLSGPYFSILNC